MLKDETGIPIRIIAGEQCYDTNGAARFSGFAPNTIRNLTQRGELSVLKIGRGNVYKRPWLEKLVNSRKIEAIF